MPLEEQTAAVTASLSLISSSDSAVIIGEPDDEYRALIQGAEAMSQLLWALAVKNGIRKKKSVLKMWTQGQMMLLQLVHDAYALGVRRGRGEERKEPSTTTTTTTTLKPPPEDFEEYAKIHLSPDGRRAK